MKRKLIMLMACFSMCAASFAAQGSNVTGVVTSSEDGQPLAGAYITVKGTNIKAITDTDGEFTLPELPSSAKSIVIVFIGMKPQEVNINSDMHVVLKSIAEIAANSDSNSIDQEVAVSDNKYLPQGNK